MMSPSLSLWLFSITLVQLASGYADFGTVTAPCAFEPIFTVPWPKFLPQDAYMRYEPYSSSITAVAPSLRFGRNGTHETSWSFHFVQQPTRTIQTIDHGLRKRGVFSDDPPVPTCRPCDGSGNPTNNGSNNNSTNGVPNCSVTSYDGVFRDGSFTQSSLPEYCFDAGYTGALVPTPISTEAGLPCCPVCYPLGTNTSFIATTGVFSHSVTFPSIPGTIALPSPGNNGIKTTVTVTATATVPGTMTRSTLSIETITPTGALGSPVTTTAFDTIIGCGTAVNGCGTVVGSGTVYLAPFGFPAVTSSGTVSGCAPTVIGCGTMIATRGTFTATGPPAVITACGEGTGSATLIGSGTVWPAGFNDMLSFVSSGTITGSGRVKGCGTITGYGTFTVSEPYTTTVTPGQQATVNVYVSYCPGLPDPMNPIFRLSGNLTSDETSPALGLTDPNDPLYNITSPYNNDNGANNNANHYALSPLLNTNQTSLNTTSTNPLCHICPQDSGICCPPFSDCGSDGHCPWTALEGCGYARFGVNLVDVRNSSIEMGMSGLEGGMGVEWGRERLRAPGLPGDSGGRGDGGSGDGSGNANGESESSSMSVRRRFLGRHVGFGHAHAHGHGLGHVLNRRVGAAHVHGHAHGH